MDKRYQVFVSSTYEDLKQERNKVITALLSLGHIPCGMEYFPAADEDAWHCIERLIPQCDYYVLLVAGKYGSIPPGSKESYTEKEYDLAISSSVPVLSLLHHNPELLSQNLCETNSQVRKKLDKFRTKAKKRLCRFWKSADQIPGELLASLPHQISRLPRIGWVRADAVASEDAKSEIITLRKRLEKADAKVEKLELERAREDGELASGEHELRVKGTIRNYEIGFKSCFSGYEDPASRQEIPFELSSTWDKLTDFLTDRTDTEFTIYTIKLWICEGISQRFVEIEKNVDSQHWDNCCASLEKGEAEKIINQLVALKLAERKKKTSRNISADTESAWSYTQKAFQAGCRQRALKKGETYMQGRTWCDIALGETEILPEPVGKSIGVKDWL